MRVRTDKAMAARDQGGWGARGRPGWLALCLFLVPIVYGCGVKPIPHAQANYAQEALHMRLVASPNLNLYDGQAHTLVLCLYQLSNPGVFQDLVEAPSGANRLLACEAFDASVTARKREVIQPSEQKELILDRAEGTRYLGIVAGYWHRQTGRFAKVITVPVVERRSGFFWTKRERYLAVVDTTVSLEDQGMEVR